MRTAPVIAAADRNASMDPENIENAEVEVEPEQPGARNRADFRRVENTHDLSSLVL